MKAFLMFRDRDFDPQQLLVRREKELRPRTGRSGIESATAPAMERRGPNARSRIGPSAQCHVLQRQFLVRSGKSRCFVRSNGLGHDTIPAADFFGLFEKSAGCEGHISYRNRDDRSREKELFELLYSPPWRNPPSGGRGSGRYSLEC